jgi:MYXO-CTERM domain-containing protein
MRHSLLGFATVAAALTLGPATARAQSLRPHIMFVFDTSGSMLDNASGNTVGEGSNICSTTATTSRLYGLKSGIRAALAQAGTDEANFGLMSFPTVVVSNPNTSNWCGSGTPPLYGHYRATPARTAISTPNRTSTGNHGATDYPYGCLLSSNSTETTYGTWFSTAAAEVVRVGVTSAAPGSVPTAGQYDPPDANIAAIYRWIDNVELPTTSAAVTDPELHGTGYTPLGRSLFYARMYYDNLVKPTDPKGSCRQNVVILVTDGAETCDETTAPNNTFVTTSTMTPPTDLCTGGGNYNPFHPVAQACLLQKAGIKVYVITDTTTGTANDTIAAAGGTGTAVRVSLSDANAAKTAIVSIIASTVPPVEVCNGRDDNCNGQIDEGVSNTCRTCTAGSGIAACGTFVIAPDNMSDPDNVVAQNGGNARHCAVETCNCLDDDCDGQIDEGLTPNACGQPCGCAVPTELCDGLDNDCDGDIDEGFMVGASCNNNGVGICRRGGILACRADKTGTFCDAPTVPPQTEVCNGLDDDCDGMIDEGTLPGVGERCGNGLGTCQSGTFVCSMGKLVCNATGTPLPETCNGIDDNCDGVIDNGTFPQTGQVCLCPGLTQAQIDAPGAVCKAGRLICRGTMGFVCEGCQLPTVEVCDGKDNNCDGMIDSQAQCPSGFGCRDGQCILQCVGGEMPCPPGYKCLNQFCVPQRCQGITCPSGERCDENTGACVDLCTGVSCTTPKTCIAGRCLDCNDPLLACAAPQICVAGRCQNDPCLNKTCPSGQYCDDGACKDLCVPGKCGDKERCVAGLCQPDPCWNVGCVPGQFCNPLTAKCENDRCPGTQCGAGNTCVPMTNMCKPDPCKTIVCPSDCWTCKVSADGIGTCVVDAEKCEPVNILVGQKGGGNAGCSCEVGGRTSSFGPLGLLLGLGLVFARRRRR